MDLKNRNPQPGMRSNDFNPTRPQQYANAPVNRPSVDGMTPPPSPAYNQPASQPPVNDHGSVSPQPAPAQPQILEPTHHSSSKPVILAIITLLIAGALAVTAFFAFRPETEDKINKVNTPSTTQQAAPSTSDAVDSATSDINKQIDSLNDTQDFPDTELTDQSLGL